MLTVQTIKEINSPINGLIKVMLVLNRPRLTIGGMLQSGGLVMKIWEKAIKKLFNQGQAIDRALIIGLGCGNCTVAINKYYPKAQLLGVEIDKEVVDIAECYFNLAANKNLTVAIDDGLKYAEKLVCKKEPPKFDLVIVDVYVGYKIPKRFKTKKFFLTLSKLLTDRGVVVFNHLFFKQYKQEAEKLIKEMEQIFKKISLQRTASNLLIFSRH